MLEEAMAQLMANQEKIAESEGNGPSWDDKVCEMFSFIKNSFTFYK